MNQTIDQTIDQAMSKKFSFKEALGFGLDMTKDKFWFFVRILLFILLLNILYALMDEMLEGGLWSVNKGIVWLGLIALTVVSWIVEVGLIAIILKLYDKRETRFSDLLNVKAITLFQYIIGSILYGLIIIGGLILLIVPGIIWAIKFQFFSYFIVDKRVGTIVALKKSAAITQGIKGQLLLFDLVLGIINIAGALLLLIGLFLTLPMTMLAMAFVYRDLLDQTEKQDKKPAENAKPGFS